MLLALPLTLALLAAGVTLLARRWQAEAARTAKESALVVADARREAAGLRRIQAEYAGLHLQPYTQLAEELETTVIELENAATGMELAWQELEARRESRHPNRLRAILQSAPEAYTQKQLALDLAHRRTGLQKLLETGYSLVRRLETVHVEVSGRAMRAAEGIHAFEGSLGALERAGLHGRMLEEAADVLLQLQQAHGRIPAQGRTSQPHQMETAEDEPASDHRQTAGLTHDLLGAIEPLLGEWLPRIQGWEQQHRRLLEAGQRLQNTHANFRSALNEAPAQLVVTHYQAALLKVGAAAADLEARRSGAEIQDLRALERETSHLERTLQETALNFDRAVLETNQLDRLLLQLEADFKLLAGRMAQTEIHDAYPLAWDATLAARNDLQEKIGALGGRGMKRTPDQVSQALASGKQLLERLAGLLEKTTEQNERYADLLRLLESPDLAQGGDWARKAVQLSREVAVFDPANWNRQDDVSGLLRDVDALDELQRRLVPVDRPVAIKESGLGRRLEETRQLAGLHQRLRPRVERIRQRLAELREQDREARDDTERLSATIDQIVLLLNGNSYLQETAAVELSRLRGEVGRLLEEFGRPEAGVLEKKVQRLKASQDALARSVSGWLDRLAANIQTHTRSIADTLAQLDQAAVLEDREVSDARELLRRLGLAPAYTRPNGYLEAAAELKRCAADWQLAAAGASALEACAQPVLAAVRDADDARRAARAVFQSAAKLAGGKREWPPVRPALQAEFEEFRKLEARLDGLRAQRWSAGRLVRELGLLYHELDKMDDRAREALRQAESERSAALDAEREVLDLQRRWQGIILRYPDQPGIGDSARDLVAQAEQRLNYLRSQYRRGTLEYDQALAGLEDTAAGLRAARFTTSDGKSVGIEP